ncbi:RNase adapter RapZ [Desulfonatronum thioautotrophicum]|uniref:RNase adapter RapZ n=1 Tax=Desulfonatronum thioautotrophicum TaxID=617001 RepID=UPI0005EBB8D2|nr:RNase adapter RapZ [Desulfonatronum thioautotrophicum]
MSVNHSQKPDELSLVMVAGQSGAGKSTVLNVFEDLGFYCVDGLPASLAAQLVTLSPEMQLDRYPGVALGLDVRQPDFVQQWEHFVERMDRAGMRLHLIFLEARDAVLIRRYATTRRPHPLEAQGMGLDQAIFRERVMLEGLRKHADVVVDTSDFSIHDLRRMFQEKWPLDQKSGEGMRIHLISFGFKYGVPMEADLVFDLRFLPNPYFEPALRPLSGLDEPIAQYVLADDPGKEFIGRFEGFLRYLLPLYAVEGRYRLTLALGCTGGRHRSVAVSQAILGALTTVGFSVTIEHRHLDLG